VKLLLIWIAFAIFFVSCDPAQTIEIENKSNKSSTIKFFFNGDDYYKFKGFLTKDSLVLGLDSGKSKVFNFGIGTWKIHNSSDSLVDRVKKIEIETEKSTQLYKTDNKSNHSFGTG
jgi:hypothetical protein